MHRIVFDVYRTKLQTYYTQKMSAPDTALEQKPTYNSIAKAIADSPREYCTETNMAECLRQSPTLQYVLYCPAGMFSKDNQCSPCRDGSYQSNSDHLETSCEQCSLGTYSSAVLFEPTESESAIFAAEMAPYRTRERCKPAEPGKYGVVV